MKCFLLYICEGGITYNYAKQYHNTTTIQHFQEKKKKEKESWDTLMLPVKIQAPNPMPI
jgi:hypothetical protein